MDLRIVSLPAYTPPTPDTTTPRESNQVREQIAEQANRDRVGLAERMAASMDACGAVCVWGVGGLDKRRGYEKSCLVAVPSFILPMESGC